MAPVARRKGATGVSKPVHRKRNVPRNQPSDSWNLLDSSFDHRPRVSYSDQHEEAAEEEEDWDDDVDDVDGEQDNALLSIESLPDVASTMNPLREMADRVEREVETFAVSLDRFLSDLPSSKNFQAARELVVEFTDLTEDAVGKLKQSSEKELRAQLRREWDDIVQISALSTVKPPAFINRTPSVLAKKQDEVKAIQALQTEADTWDLFRIILDLHYNPDKDVIRREKDEELARMPRVGRLTPESELWERLYLQDDLANERRLIKHWLERTAAHEQSDLQGIVEELEAKAGRGKGLWSQGWMYTREQIKAQKRLRTWPAAVDSPQPQIRRTDNNELLVTTVDPDALARHDRTLEKPDAYFERAMWVACWEMLRRGSSWEEVCTWCEERNEGWRAVSIGKASREENLDKTALWRRMCLLASQSRTSSDYEAAVYGLLGGGIQSVESVCRTVDDHLFAHYSAALLRQFETNFSSNSGTRAPHVPFQLGARDDLLTDSQHAENDITQLIRRLRQRPDTQRDAARPLKTIQSYLLAHELDSFAYTLGRAISRLDAERGGEEDIIIRIPELDGETVSLHAEQDIALNPQALRIATHMVLVLRKLAPDDALESTERDLLENIIVAYIQTLRTAGKRDLIPLYASTLHRPRYIVTLSRVLQDIHNPKEQSEMLNLMMDQYHLDVVTVLDEQINWLVDTLLRKDGSGQPFEILQTSEEPIHPGFCIMNEFLPEELTDLDFSITRALHWYQLLRGSWTRTFDALTLALTWSLLAGRFALARVIVREYPYDLICTQKTFEVLGRSINFMEYTGSLPGDPTEAAKWQTMKRQSRAYYELERLVVAIESLAPWREEEFTYSRKVPKPTSVPAGVKQNFNLVKEAMAPILDGILMEASTENDAHNLAAIRVMYFPELILAYNAVLHSAGNLITREALLDSMDLATIVIEEKNGIMETFVETGRVREVLQSFSRTSREMLRLKYDGKAWKPKRDRVGRDLGIWEIGRVGGSDPNDGVETMG